jgi:hypothetical protein
MTHAKFQDSANSIQFRDLSVMEPSILRHNFVTNLERRDFAVC